MTLFRFLLVPAVIQDRELLFTKSCMLLDSGMSNPEETEMTTLLFFGIIFEQVRVLEDQTSLISRRNIKPII